MSRSTILWVCLGSYALICLFVGILTTRRTKTLRSFFMANRSLGPVAASLAMFASLLSGIAFVGGPGFIYAKGFGTSWIVITSVIGTTLAFSLLGKRLRGVAEVYDCLSLPEAIEVRYRCRWCRTMSAALILLGVLGYLGVQIGALKIAVEFCSRELYGTEAPNPWLGMGAIVFVLLVYSVGGGMLASVYTDVIQAFIMIFGALFVAITAASLFEGGLEEAITLVEKDSPGILSPFGAKTPLACLSLYFLYALGTCAQPHVINKFMMLRRFRDIKTMLPIMLLCGMIGSVIWLVLGIVVRAKVLTGAYPELGHPDQTSFAFLTYGATPWLAAIVSAGLFAAIMSTFDSFLNIGAAALIHDLPSAWRKTPRQGTLFEARVATVTLVILSAWIAVSWDKGFIIDLGIYAWSAFAAGLVPVLAVGYNWKKASPRAARVSLVIALFGLTLFQVTGFNPPHGIDRGATVLLMALLAFIVVSWISPERGLPDKVSKIMDL